LANFKTTLGIQKLIEPIAGTNPQMVVTLWADLLVIF
jgi:hypothetical protein